MSNDDILAAPAEAGALLVPPPPGEAAAAADLAAVQATEHEAFEARSRFGRLPIEALGEVELKVEVVLGRARLRLQELLDVRPGQAIELDRARNSPVDVLVNGTLFARGEIVVIDDTNLGVRVSEVVGSDPVKEGHA